MNLSIYVPDLKAGKSVSFKAIGSSMRPKIISGDTVMIMPFTTDIRPSVGDIVLCKVKGKYYLHLISAAKGKGDSVEFQISNNSGFVNGWTSHNNIFGKVSAVNS